MSKESSFIGLVPEFYERYLVPMHFEAHARIMVDRLGEVRSGHLLEVAAGTGAVTRLMARELPDTVKITATDLNEPMLEVARVQPGTERVQWQREEAISLSFPDGSLQFGVMFFPHKVCAFRETFRVLKPGGCFIFSVWDRAERNPLVEVVQHALLSLFPEEIVRTNLVPFSYHEPEVIRADLAAAGFVESELQVVIGRTQAPSAHAVAIATVQGNFLRPQIEACGPEWLERATETVSNEITASFGEGSLTAPNQALLVTAHKDVASRDSNHPGPISDCPESSVGEGALD
jgi:ubiquinone/menaquinone biosynthesis C-methylase UbiE